MEKPESLEQFYRSRMGALPGEMIRKTGHFNVFRLSDLKGGDGEQPMPYSRKDYYKISLITGRNEVHYADKTMVVEENMLLFANPLIPYNWAPAGSGVTAVFCVFTEDFFKGYGNIREYPLYRPDGFPVLDLSNEEAAQVRAIYNRMFEEIASDYAYKYDVLRNLVLDIIHTALKLRPGIISTPGKMDSNASERITALFLELLERQFPIESVMQTIRLRAAGEFAAQLNLHVNHLNKVLKEATGKTTSALIAERMALEARALLKHTNWTISEIAGSLGFEDLSHFIRFFKKYTQVTPREFRR
ncbi:AraC family transcriptional regulator [Chitinophaga alhagiae]|uniref:AraC family transcriptional regulator n=1 Tax=Chitinophaga alhagiae TaxID=2203219 RepID=A0ABN5LLT0_9BACT|nr:AraC family transcriptional regulator [Chitinophaga alhagiae]AWO00315.1 AraC family transcriptional regulator [Chitinophaga alhagiae]